MNDLMKCLYEFMIAKRLGSIWDDPEYNEIAQTAEHQRNQIEKNLSQEQKKELKTLLETISELNGVTSEHQFCASLGLAKELNGLVRA